MTIAMTIEDVKEWSEAVLSGNFHVTDEEKAAADAVLEATDEGRIASRAYAGKAFEGIIATLRRYHGDPPEDIEAGIKTIRRILKLPQGVELAE